MPAFLSIISLVASISIGTLLGLFSIGLIYAIVQGPDFERVRATLRRRGVVLIWELSNAADLW